MWSFRFPCASWILPYLDQAPGKQAGKENVLATGLFRVGVGGSQQLPSSYTMGKSRRGKSRGFTHIQCTPHPSPAACTINRFHRSLQSGRYPYGLV